MSREGNFLIFCIKQYKATKGLNGKQVSEIFSRYDVGNYVYSCFEALHTTDANYIVNDIDQFIAASQLTRA